MTDSAENDRTPHTHGGTDAPECTPYGIKCPPAEKDAVLAVLREYWPESGGQSGYHQTLGHMDACADAIMRVFSPGKGDGNATQ